MSTEIVTQAQELIIDSEKETQELHSEQEIPTKKNDGCSNNTQHDHTKTCEVSSNQPEVLVGGLSNQTVTLMDVDECGLWTDKRLREEKRLLNSTDNPDNTPALTQQDYINMFLDECRKAK